MCIRDSLGESLSEGLGLVDAINKSISERGEVLDSASEALGHIRSEMKVTHSRLMERMNRYLNDPATTSMLQEALITQRSGRYVLPLRAEFKGRIPACLLYTSDAADDLPGVDFGGSRTT